MDSRKAMKLDGYDTGGVRIGGGSGGCRLFQQLQMVGWENCELGRSGSSPLNRAHPLRSLLPS